MYGTISKGIVLFFMKYLLIILLAFPLIIINSAASEKQNSKLDRLVRGASYTVELTNGDVLTGEYLDDVHSQEDGDGIKLATEIGNASIFNWQIARIYFSANDYRYDSKMLVLPTAYPIGRNHYLALVEGVMPEAGVGIGNWISLRGGCSILPVKRITGQFAYVNAKCTIFNGIIDSSLGNFALAPGLNFATLGGGNNFWHAFVSASLDFGTTIISANIFYKMSGGDLYSYRFQDNLWNFGYSDGAFGLSFGIDKKLNARGLDFFAEVVNGDVNEYKKSAADVGIRFSNSKFGADLGIGFALGGSFPVPIMQFHWTPF